MKVKCVKWLQIIQVDFCVNLYLDRSNRVSDDALHWALIIHGDRCAALLLDMAESEETFIIYSLQLIIQS